MNADETVRGLRYTQNKYENKAILTGETDVSAMCRDAADLIESLQDQKCRQGYGTRKMQSNALPKAGRMWRNTMENAELIKPLKKQEFER